MDMALPASRPMNAELHEGMTDGLYKKIVNDRGGVVEEGTWEARDDLNDWFFGIHEARNKELPDGTYHTVTPYFHETQPAMFTPPGWRDV